ncbi:LADA_0G05688g1_1 [Lachancea dasiensis]|uniref:LADA_0G05688g1_1 n=1 Tax=Lachancea dasiensis TaxID=1072105 RepID=A0A1G4JT22_9SACH|nr:LADA_0G05688g1_1 [Lachancea dasiensis]
MSNPRQEMVDEQVKNKKSPPVVPAEDQAVKSSSSHGTTTGNAAHPQNVPPERVSELLLQEGPLAIRFITKALCIQLPGFGELSASKQRRLIMGALETGDRKNGVVFAKIGWGQWSAKKVDSPDKFEREREITNLANSKVKDMVSQERRKSSGLSNSSTARPRKSSVVAKREGELRPGNWSTFLDENALASEDEDEGGRTPHIHGRNDHFHDDDDESQDPSQHILPYDFFKRRKSSVVYAENSPPDDSEFESGPPLAHPGMKTYRRSSSSKKRSPSIGKRNSFRGSNTSLEAVTRRLSSPANSLDDQATPNLTQQKDAKNLSNHHTRGREPRLSFSKESSLRSTLLSHASCRSSPIQPPLDSHMSKEVAYKLNSPSSGTNAPGPSNGEDEGAIFDEHDEDDGRSDTDEEDWQHIGAESLRNSRAPSQVRSPHSPAISNSLLDRQPPHLSLSPPVFREGSERVPKSETGQSSPKHEPQAETQDAAILLMSLKS